ncbi:MAG: hypothetical protein HZA31_06510 [Opitutae bacterium]|nr:hypothetical protein [Opitutae bacterium]
MSNKTTEAVDPTANQTVRLDLGTIDGVKSMRIGFTDQRLTAKCGNVRAYTPKVFSRAGGRRRHESWRRLTQARTSPNMVSTSFSGVVWAVASRHKSTAM